MIGRTNVGGGGGSGSSFLAYLQVTTDPNAVITAVNLAGDTFSGTADNTGSLVLNITEPGTYTITETGGGTGTVVVADDGETYSITVVGFDGYIVKDGEHSSYYEIEGRAAVWSGGGGIIEEPTVTEGATITNAGVQYTVVDVLLNSINGTQCVVVTTEKVDITDYDNLKMLSLRMTSGTFGVGLFNDPSGSNMTLISGTNGYTSGTFDTLTFDVSSYSGEYYVGAYISKPSNQTDVHYYIADLWVE